MTSSTGTQSRPIRPAEFPVTFNALVHCRTHLVTRTNTGIHRGENLDHNRLGYDTVHIGRSPTFIHSFIRIPWIIQMWN
jgi:hypothetical protein